MRALRTPDDRFDAIDGFDVAPRYAQVADPDGGDPLQMAWVEAGPVDGEPVLLLHGEPSWSFLYRQLLPPLADAGLRAVAPDLIGFGRSDKPTERGDHSYARHVEWLRALAFDVLDLRGVTLVGQDWGGLLGLRLAAEHRDRFARLVLANTGLPSGDHDMPEIWHRFKDAVESATELDVARVVASGCVRGLSDSARSAYDAPFPDETFKAGPRAMPGLVPIRPDDPASDANRAAWTTLTEWDVQVLVAFSDSDPITGAMRPILERALPGARGREHPVLSDAGHFLQEDAGAALAEEIVAFVRETRRH